MLRQISNKKAAMELSMSTVVVLVLAMLMLGLGIVLVRTIFTTATDSVNTVDVKVQAQLASLFNDEKIDVVISLGPDHTARIKPDTQSLGIGVAARTPDGELTEPDRLKFKLSLDTTATTNCYKKLGQPAAEALFITPLNVPLSADQTDSSNSFLTVQVKVPKG